MSWRLTAILALILALLAGYYAYFEMTVFPRRDKEKEEAKKIFAFKADEISQITLQRQDTEIVCIRDNGKWKMLKPVLSSGDDAALELMAAVLVEAKYEKRLEEEPVDWKPFGLDPATIELWLTKKDGTASKKLALGGKSPTDAYVYARLDQDKNILLLPARLMENLNKNVFDLRDKRLFDFKPEQVDGVEVAAASWRMVAHRVDRERWAMVVPLDAPAQSSKINFLLGKLKDWRVKEFITEKAEDLSPYGLDEPAYTIHVKTGTAAGGQILTLGKKDEAKKGVFARMKNADNVVMLDVRVMEDLPKEVFALREKDFIRIHREKVEKVRLTYPEARILLAKKADNQWAIEEPVQMRADPYKVTNLVADADDMEIVKFLDSHQPSPEGTGLDSPAVRAEFWIKGEEAPVGLELGRKTDDGKGVYARQIGKSRVDVVDAKNLASLTRTASELRLKRLLDFNNKDVEAIHMTLAGKEIEIRRSGNRWEMTRPEKKELSSAQVLSFLWALNDLEFQEVISEHGKDVPASAFEKTQLKVKLLQKDGQSLASLSIGSEVPDKKVLLYCRVEGMPQVLAVEPGLVNKAEKALEKARR